MNRDEALTFLQQHKQAVLATIGKDGRPQLTNVLVVYKDGRLVASITETRVKYRNLQHDPRVTVLIQGDSFWQFLVVEGTGTMTSMPDALPALREYYRLATGGDHSNWEEYDAAMASDRRVLLEISIDRMYPLSE